MGDTELPPAGAGRGGERAGTACRGARPPHGDPAWLAGLYRTHHRSLTRLAALLTGDAGAAEAVVWDAFAALHQASAGTRACDHVACLRRFVVTRSRRAAHRHHLHDAQQETPGFEDSAIVTALHALPHAQREALVLTLYLDLTDDQAAAAMLVTPATLRRQITAARTALRATLPPQPVPPTRNVPPT